MQPVHSWKCSQMTDGFSFFADGRLRHLLGGRERNADGHCRGGHDLDEVPAVDSLRLPGQRITMAA